MLELYYLARIAVGIAVGVLIGTIVSLLTDRRESKRRENAESIQQGRID